MTHSYRILFLSLAVFLISLGGVAHAQTPVEITISGTGEVRTTDGRFRCTADQGTCHLETASGRTLTLTIDSPLWSDIKEWGGACSSARGSTCEIDVGTEPLEISARFSIREYVALAVLLLAVVIVMARVKKVDLGHSPAFKARRIMNWLPIGMLYAFLYMGRYNLTVAASALSVIPDAHGQALLSGADFSAVFSIGTWIYGLSFLINGPFTDRRGGKMAILISGVGAAIVNGLMAGATWTAINHGPFHEVVEPNFLAIFAVLYGLNMYFQSFGAVAIVKVNAPWFDIRERGFFGATFGILISLGIYLAYDVGGKIKYNLGITEVFSVPAGLLLLTAVIVAFAVKNTPEEAGHRAFDTGDATSDDDERPLGVVAMFRLLLRNPVIVTIAFVEFCSGFLRQAVMQYYKMFAENTNEALGLKSSVVYDHWGLALCVAGILGGVFAGVISDRFFQSRRGPVAAVLYGLMLISAFILVFAYDSAASPWIAVFMSLAVIGVHGMLSGTASMDFGGRKNTGIAVGIIDGFVYAGTGVMALTYWIILPESGLNEGKVTGPTTNPENWWVWPVSMVPLALLGLTLSLRVWNARPKPKPAVAKTE